MRRQETTPWSLKRRKGDPWCHRKGGLRMLPDTKRQLLLSITVTRRAKMAGPDLDPTSRRIERRVFLEPELFEELSECAEFQQTVFKAMGVEESVSRNDMIAAFLAWAVTEFWAERGGKPTSKSDLEAKAKKQAEKKLKQKGK